MKFVCLVAILLVGFIQIDATPAKRGLISGMKKAWDKLEDKIEDVFHDEKIIIVEKPVAVGPPPPPPRQPQVGSQPQVTFYQPQPVQMVQQPPHGMYYEQPQAFYKRMVSSDGYDYDLDEEFDELQEIIVTAHQKNFMNTMMANAQTAMSKAQTDAISFFNAALNAQISLARESFLKGLEQLQKASGGYMDQGVDALKKYLPGLQGVVSSRVDAVSAALDKYVKDNKGKMDEVREILLENAQQTLNNLKSKLSAAKSTEDIKTVVNAVDMIEEQVVNV